MEEDQASVKAFQGLFPAMVQVLQDAITSGSEEQTLLSFEVFNTLLTAEYQLMQKHFTELLELMNKVASEKPLSDDIRTQAISFLMQAVIYLLSSRGVLEYTWSLRTSSQFDLDLVPHHTSQ